MTTPRLGRCPRCKQYALVAEAQGIRLALDVTPVDAIAFGKAVAGGQSLWWVKNGAERPLGVLGTYSAGRQPQWLPGGSQTGAQRLHQEHSCGAPARDIVILNTDAPKGSAPATPGARAAGNRRPAAHVAGAKAQASPSPAPSVTRRPSDYAVRCHICRKLVDQKAQLFTGIFYERWIWAEHEECP